MKATAFIGKISQGKIAIMPMSIGLVYIWFGTLKFFPGLSPAENLATATIHKLTFHVFSDQLALILLAIWEVSIGVFLLTNLFKKTALYLALLHILLTFTPFVFFPELVFTKAPFGLTLVGQYIVKNLIILGILVVLIKQRKIRQ
ncbi:doxx family protein [Lentiprolixibacter aurantiacus]|uniref:Doxx family protein n=1 Tax=Lentiprolixibacter aurantiacus TaxID=2993939 RepID=A0AAE3SNT7_9FLAO|nr:doxx family protein [Lentiprolixibacter aurantiacus]MCX2720117.1 doxx family protein [Lentiprolixibacter aurantiacus]